MATSKINLSKVKQSVQQKFAEINSALNMREKLLLRQIDVIEQQQIGRGSIVSKEKSETNEEKEIEFLVEQEEELLTAIRSFGRFQLDNMNLSYLKNEDYITPTNDHETMYKCLQQIEGGSLATRQHDEEAVEQPEAIVVDFSKNKSLIEHNAKNMNESIINITLQEAKALIQKAKVKRETPIPPLNLEELDDELESSIAEAVSSLGRESPVKTKSSQTCCAETKKATKKNRFKPKITINNCNGTINLSNISSLTINCANEETISAEIPLQRAAEQEHAKDEDEDTSTQYLKYNTKSAANVTTTTTTTTASSAVSSSVVANQKGEVPQAPISASATMETSSTGNSTPITTATSTTSSNYSSNSSSRSQSKKQKCSKKLPNNKNSLVSSTTTASATQQATCSSSASAYPYEIVHNDDADDGNPEATCDFYNRLLNEIKNSIKEKSIRTVVPIDNSQYTQAAAADSTCDSNSNASCSTSTAASCSNQPGKRLILKNYENLKIILEANSDDETFHPVQIEQWLAEIISETDLEPMQNTDILEHSKINEQNA